MIMAIDADRAIAIARDRWSPLPDGHTIVATPLPGDHLVSVALIDEDQRPESGAVTVIGPDERVWTWSSNPGIHDLDLAVALIHVAYEEGMADLVDDREFTQRLTNLTARRHEDVRQFKADLLAGSLRPPRTRRLP